MGLHECGDCVECLPYSQMDWQQLSVVVGGLSLPGMAEYLILRSALLHAAVSPVAHVDHMAFLYNVIDCFAAGVPMRHAGSFIAVNVEAG